MLTDRYLQGIPTDSRASKGTSLSTGFLSKENLGKISALNAIAEQRGQSLAQMAISWVLRDSRVTSALIGARSIAQLENSVAALENLQFSSTELTEIDRYATESGINLWASSSNA